MLKSIGLIILRFIGIFALCFVVQPVFATVNFDTYQMEQNILDAAQIVQDLAIISGIFLILGAIFKFKRYGEARSMMMQQGVGAPLMMLLAGTILLSLPTFLETAVFNFWGDIQPLDPNVPSWAESFGPGIHAILMFVRFLGVVSFVRGVFQISKAGRESSQPGTLGRGLISIFAGVLMVHIVGFAQLLEQFFGVSST